MSAFACEPGRGSEQEVGWRWAVEMARWYDVTVLTQTRNRPGIERELEQGLPDGGTLEFAYCELARPIYLLKKRYDFLTWPYYACWQWAAQRMAAELHARRPFELAHHVTFVSFRVPVWLKRLGIPVVFGPVGGAERAPANLLARGFGPLIRAKELLRNVATGGCARLLRVLPPIRTGQGICLAATPGMAAIFKRCGFAAEVFPAIGIDVPLEAPAKRSTPHDGIRFLFVGRLHPLKGVHLLLEAFARAAIPGATLTVIGGGGEELRLKRLAARLGIAARVRWEGQLPRRELAGHYARHDVFVAPSLYESGGLTVLEAMLAGLPAIVLDVGGHSVSVTPECGCKIPPTGTVDEVIERISQAMAAYATTPELIAAHGEEARRRVTAEYAWAGKAGRMRRIYQDALLLRKDRPQACNSI